MLKNKTSFLITVLLVILGGLNLFPQQGYGQKNKIKNKENETPKIHQFIDSLNNQSRDLIRIDMEQSAALAKSALEMSLTYSYEKGTSYAYRNQAILSYFSNNLSLALDYIQRAIVLFEKNQDKDGLADANITLGLIFYRLGVKEQSLKAHTEAYQHYENSPRKDRFAIAAFNLAEAYFLNEKFENALYYAKNALNVADQSSNSSLVTSCLTLIGNIYYQKEIYDSALLYYDQTIDIGNSVNVPANKESLAESFWKKGRILIASGKSEEAMENYEKSLSIAKTMSLRPLISEIYLSIIQAYMDKGNLSDAQKHLNEFISDRKFLINEENEKDAQMVTDLINFQLIEKKSKKIMEESDAKSKRLRNLSIIFALTALILLLLSGLILLMLRLLKKQKEVSELKDRFVSMASHEFKTPLAVIASSLELLLIYKQKIEDEGLQEKIGNHIGKIYRQEKRLLALVDDILIFEKLSQKKYSMQPEEVSMEEFIPDLLENLPEGEMKAKPLGLSMYGNQRPLVIDRNLLYHLLINLLSNAYKYSPDAQAPEMNIRFLEDKISITIRDFGIGIADSDKNLLFSSFFRGKNVGNIKGTGIGLSLVKAILDLTGGSISVESGLNKGSCFTLLLPYQSVAD